MMVRKVATITDISFIHVYTMHQVGLYWLQTLYVFPQFFM